MTSEALKALAERVEAATGGDRELDARLSVVVADAVIMRYDAKLGYSFYRADEDTPRWPFLSNCTRGEDEAYQSLGGCLSIAPYTSSIDAALGLVERVLPGVEIDMKKGTGSREWHVTLTGFPYRIAERARTLPVALCRALLRALLANGE